LSLKKNFKKSKPFIMKKNIKNETRFLNPLTDFGFHRLFGTESSKKFLISFLNEIVREESLITEIQYLPPIVRGFTEIERKAVFDILCTNEKGEYFIVEMQRAKQKFFRDRSLFYASLPIQKQAPQGIWDFRLKAVYLIAVLDFIIFNEFEEDNNHVIEYVNLVRERTKTYFSKKINFVFVELPKFTKKEEELITNFDFWMYSLKNMDKLNDFPSFVQNKIFEELFRAADINILTKKEMKNYKKSVLEYRDVKSSIELAREEALEEGIEIGIKKGLEQGVEQGLERAKIAIILKCFQKNMPVEDIVYITGFSEEYINQYVKEQQ